MQELLFGNYSGFYQTWPPPPGPPGHYVPAFSYWPSCRIFGNRETLFVVGKAEISAKRVARKNSGGKNGSGERVFIFKVFVLDRVADIVRDGAPDA